MKGENCSEETKIEPQSGLGGMQWKSRSLEMKIDKAAREGRDCIVLSCIVSNLIVLRLAPR